MNKCTRCDKDFKDFIVDVQMNISTNRIKDNGILEGLPNLSQSSREVLCTECFQLFADNLSEIMKRA